MAPGSAAVGPTRYGDRLLAAPIPTLWEPRSRAQTLQGRVAERAIARQMALIGWGRALRGLPVAFRGLACWLPKALPAACAWSGLRTSCQLAGSCRGVARKKCQRPPIWY